MHAVARVLLFIALVTFSLFFLMKGNGWVYDAVVVQRKLQYIPCYLSGATN